MAEDTSRGEKYRMQFIAGKLNSSGFFFFFYSSDCWHNKGGKLARAREISPLMIDTVEFFAAETEKRDASSGCI